MRQKLRHDGVVFLDEPLHDLAEIVGFVLGGGGDAVGLVLVNTLAFVRLVLGSCLILGYMHASGAFRGSFLLTLTSTMFACMVYGGCPGPPPRSRALRALRHSGTRTTPPKW